MRRANALELACVISFGQPLQSLRVRLGRGTLEAKVTKTSKNGQKPQHHGRIAMLRHHGDWNHRLREFFLTRSELEGIHLDDSAEGPTFGDPQNGPRIPVGLQSG